MIPTDHYLCPACKVVKTGRELIDEAKKPIEVETQNSGIQFIVPSHSMSDWALLNHRCECGALTTYVLASETQIDERYKTEMNGCEKDMSLQDDMSSLEDAAEGKFVKFGDGEEKELRMRYVGKSTNQFGNVGANFKVSHINKKELLDAKDYSATGQALKQLLPFMKESGEKYFDVKIRRDGLDKETRYQVTKVVA